MVPDNTLATYGSRYLQLGLTKPGEHDFCEAAKFILDLGKDLQITDGVLAPAAKNSAGVLQLLKKYANKLPLSERTHIATALSLASSDELAKPLPEKANIPELSMSEAFLVALMSDDLPEIICRH
ncbi:MAG: hypothetical protein ASARMPRED_008283 [Alectoria sarmentosa]|nr:MAG: hypothetical protein ASARMPRED_008283 [Alectoria sarmentosa]